ncbi:MAG: phosphoribosylglycinamide formyltransferase [Muribaculaceae bacterium]|nr:phosphoribosylglycinamide formyltransferase [Muribaculaceae bacterium]
MKRIAIFASGSGTNAENIVRYFAYSTTVQVALVITNRQTAGVIDRLRPLGIDVEYFPKAEWRCPVCVTQQLIEAGVDLVVLAGFLAVVREPLLSSFAGHIINIHPSLLPKYGGEGMWGGNVHEAVIQAGDSESGITIHQVTAHIDGGPILAQHTCPVFPDDTPETLETRIHHLEYVHYPRVIELLLASMR